MALVESPNAVPAAWVPDGGLPPTVPPDRWSRPAPHTMAVRIAIGLFGLALAYLAGRRGAPAWQVLRVAVVLGLTVAVLFGERRAASAWRDLLLAATGLVGTVAGIGIGLPYAAKAGLTLPCVAGVLALACGLVLLVMGVVGRTRRVHRWRRPLVAVAALVVVVVVVPPLAVAVAATNVPPPRLGAATPASLGLAYSDASFPATDGVRLSGWYIASRTGAAVVLAHGAGSTRSDVLPQAVALARHGYGVLLFDARGHGRSEGTAMDFGWYGDADIGGAVSYVAAQPGVDSTRIAAMGMSMGGEQAVGALAGDARIRAVVAEGATVRVARDRAWLSTRYGVPGWIQERIEGLQTTAADLMTSASPPVTLRDAVRAAVPRPVLLITAGTVADEGHAAAYIQAGSPATVQVWTVPGAGHTQGLATQPAAWEARVTGFLEGALTPRS